MLRFVLYVLFIVLFIVKEIFVAQNFGAAPIISQVFVLAYIALCTEFAIRLIGSYYWPLPLFLASSMAMRHYDIMHWAHDYVLDVIEIAILAFIGYILLKKGNRMRLKGRVRSGVGISVVGIVCMLFMLKLLAVFMPGQFDFLKWIFRSFIFSMVFILAASSCFLNKSIWTRNPLERDLFLFMIIIHTLRILMPILQAFN